MRSLQHMRTLFVPSILAASILFVPTVLADDCKDGWCKGGCDEKRCMRVKLISKNNEIVSVDLSNNRGVGKAEYNCKDYTYRFIRDNQTKSDWMPTQKGSASRTTAEVACNLK
ncbi:hypothetical protein [Synechococcus sp. MIT S9507]|uniref:hypothetical protein n=1 Tax=Synechococcus sp. MIT S9507 TaxID=3082544 RepID=UPI0039B69E3D